MNKQMWIDTRERLVAEYLEDHPDADEYEACEATAKMVDDAMADYGDYLHDAARDRRMEDGQ